MPENFAFWLGFNVFVLVMLALDLGVLNRKAHVVKFREALAWSAVWVSLAAGFTLLVYLYGATMAASPRPNSALALEFLTGYLIELSLSVDNLFVFLLIFRYFNVPRVYQHTALFWGIIGALVFRALFILAGVQLIERFDWIIYVFGAFLLYTGVKLFKQQETDVHPEHNPFLRAFRRIMPITRDYHGSNFFVRMGPRYHATPLAVVLIVIETTDIIFAVDSIPAIFGITHEPFIIYTSNVFAILGLRSLFFALAGLMDMFKYLHYGLAIILSFIGAKMLLHTWLHIPIWLALAIVVGVLSLSVVASVVYRTEHRPKAVEPEREAG